MPHRIDPKMRESGTRVELVWMQPHDHIGWAFDGADQFATIVEGFLKQGRDLGERLLLVVEDPDAEAYRRIAGEFAPAELEIARIADVYGPSGVVDAAAQRATFNATLAQALADGYTGIRVAADNSSLVCELERLQAWTQWEMVADQFMSENNVTGLCGFDRTRVNVNTLRHLLTLHPLSSAEEPVPQFRIFAEGPGLCLEGDVDEVALTHLQKALALLGKKPTPVNIRGAALQGLPVKKQLHDLAASGALVLV